MIATLATELNLNSTQAEWLENTQNNVNMRLLPFQIINFLDQNLWRIEAKNFAQEAIGVLIDGGEVDFVNEIIKDKSFVGTKADCILNALITQGNNIFRKTSEAFTKNRSKFKLKFTLINEPSNIADAQTPFPDSNSNGIITIEVNEPEISGSNYLDYDKAILHETIHAELHRLKIAGNLGPNSMPSEQYNLYMHMWDFYEEVNSSPNYIATQSQHYLMAQYYIDNIAKGLWEFNQFQANMSDYKHLAWEGLNSYGIQGEFITQNELDNLSNMYSNVPKNSDPCN
ncbi:hypothetical protein [Leeuwenhoekiella aequorea]|uniref:Uncharacterized protein n=1 Tax=Leeuwenhoekiella aequorea TaxID=283736 RepID=A0A4Q0P660_9FLAO|nr:hypothetical protein [Leeuwenhoekiella aequorea]AOE09668.1 hypothetical protein [uncultured bacterium]RXG22137.1 hypothetical protein DSM00_2202 [Leeuwenhoekiella aequorea]